MLMLLQEHRTHIGLLKDNDLSRKYGRHSLGDRECSPITGGLPVLFRFLLVCVVQSVPKEDTSP